MKSAFVMLTLIQLWTGIGDTEWLYKCSFPFDRSQQHLYGLLKFDGLDTVCDVYLVSYPSIG